MTPTQRRRAQRKRAKAAVKVGARQVCTPVAKSGEDTAAAPLCPNESRGASVLRYLPPPDKRGAEEEAVAQERSVLQRSHERGQQQREVLRNDEDV